jgi:hypothetical protein
MRVGWYLRRLRRMGTAEIAWRATALLRQQAWRRRRGEAWPMPAARPCWQGGVLPAGATGDAAARQALADQAEAVLAGAWPTLAASAEVSGNNPDWHRDPLTGRVAPAATYGFDVPYRDEEAVGNVKHLWELSRLHHVTLLAAAFHQGGDARHAERAVAHLRSWWCANPPLCGVHWVSGIELGLRLIGWVWARRLLQGWPGVAATFENNPSFQRQLHAHQSWLAAFRSRGSSANNHLIAELCGLLTASLAFPLSAESAHWARDAARALETEAARQTFPDGMNRELAGAYHVFVLELLLVAGCEADAACAPLSDAFWQRVAAMADALAATVDARLSPSRQGDSDDGRVLVLDAPDRPAASVVLDACAQLLGAAPWWPEIKGGSVTAACLAQIGRRRALREGRPATRPHLFPQAGIAILRHAPRDAEEIWCRFDHGPHGFLATAAHAHADALSFELRLGGQEILIDPGTYCYHGEGAWRDRLRATIAHNALELGGRSQAEPAGPFLWHAHPAATLLSAEGLEGGPRATVEACHDAYRALSARHRRRLTLDRAARRIEVLDVVEAPGPLPARLAFHLHPDIACTLQGPLATLSWAGAEGPCRALLELPAALRWAAGRGDGAPAGGWYSPRFGLRLPTTTLLGTGLLHPGQALHSVVAFLPALAPPQRGPRSTQVLETG